MKRTNYNVKEDMGNEDFSRFQRENRDSSKGTLNKILTYGILTALGLGLTVKGISDYVDNEKAQELIKYTIR
jgi:hypothetical protein